MNWDEYFMGLCNPISKKSKDPDTKLGAIIVGADNQILSAGFNSFPRGINDNVPERLVRPEKYVWIEHAERNAIYNAARSGIALKGGTIYVQLMPCIDCARGIVQSGIKRVVLDKEITEKRLNDPKWINSFKATTQLFEEAGVELVLFDSSASGVNNSV